MRGVGVPFLVVGSRGGLALQGAFLFLPGYRVCGCRKLVPFMPVIPSYQGMYTPTSAPSCLLSYSQYLHRVSGVEYGPIACVSPYPTQSICAPFSICPASVYIRLARVWCLFLFRLACFVLPVFRPLVA